MYSLYCICSDYVLQLRTGDAVIIVYSSVLICVLIV